MIETPYKISQLLGEARQRMNAQQLPEAESLLRAAITLDSTNQEALQNLVVVALQLERLDVAEEYLAALVQAYPLEVRYCDHYAAVLMRLGKTETALAAYTRLLENQPGFTDARYNFARLLKRLGQADRALEQYRIALNQGIAKPAEVHLNIAVIYTELGWDTEARASLQRALQCEPAYIPALYNLAIMEEEQGDINRAKEIFAKILELDPHSVDAIVRLAYCQKISDPAHPLVARMRHELVKNENNALALENLNYALGKAADDTQNYSAAAEHYVLANAYGKKRSDTYDPVHHEALCARLKGGLLEHVEPVSCAPLIFICGMFRSGSTLLEQMLAAHPQLVVGGEIAYFKKQAPLPATLSWDSAALSRLGEGYLMRLQELHTEVERVTNKRPDNFLYLGIILSLFPRAHILNTCRHPLDNACSIYSQPFESGVAYDTDLIDIGHFYVQYRALMKQWKTHYPDNILDVDYDELVVEPQVVLSQVLTFLGLPWNPACLEFHQHKNRVRTASVWQVRQPLYRQSSGRCGHYVELLSGLGEYLAGSGVDV